MSSRILTTDFSGLDDFMQDHAAVLAKSASGAVAVFANNAPAFYALTPERLAQLLELEAKLARPNSDIALDAQFFDEPTATPVAVEVAREVFEAAQDAGAEEAGVVPTPDPRGRSAA